MARRKNQNRSEPSLAPGEPTSEGLNPLEHGHVAGQRESEETAGQTEDQETNPDSQARVPNTPTIETIQAQMLAMEERHANEVAALRRQIPPSVPKQEGQAPPEDDKLDELLFTDPKAAIKKIREQVGGEIEAKLTKKYGQAENTRKFWESFEGKYGDLKDDRDLVELTMNANIDKLANIPVEQAMEKLAELTRNRIRRYTGTRPKAKKAFAEGSGQPLPTSRQEETPEVVSIGDLIKRRRASRHGKASAA